MPEVMLQSGRRPGQRYAYLLARIQELLQRYGEAKVVGGEYCGYEMANSLSHELGCHCLYRLDADRYEFSDKPFPQPAGQEKHLWRVIR